MCFVFRESQKNSESVIDCLDAYYAVDTVHNWLQQLKVMQIILNEKQLILKLS